MAVAQNHVLPFRGRMPTNTREQTSAEEARTMGRAIKALREARSLTQQDAAEALGVTRTAWQNYENGRAVILRTDVQRRLLKALGSDEDELAAHVASIQSLGRRTGQVVAMPERFDIQPRGQAVFPLSEGDVVVTFPPDLSNEGFAELAEYLNLFLKARGAKLANT